METPPFASPELVRIRHNRWVMGAAASPILLSLGLVLASMATHQPYVVMAPHTFFVGIALAFYAWRRNWRPLTEGVAVRADARGLTVGELFLPRDQIRAAYVLPGATPRVQIRRKLALPIHLQVSDTREARALLRALGLDVSQTVSSFRTQSRAVSKRRYTVGALGGFFGLYAAFISGVASTRQHPATGAGLGIFFAVGLISLITVLLMPTWVDVGADGITLRWFGRKRFYGYGEIVDVTRFLRGRGRSRQVGLDITLRSAEVIPVPVGSPSWNDDELMMLEERIHEGMESWKAGDASADAALLRRGERPLGEWIGTLRAIGAGANADMRVAPLPRERLFRILESPSAGSTDRAAAAIALGQDLDDESRARLRSAAEACAAPKLRIALEAAAKGDDEAELEAALAEVGEEEKRTSA
jgi:hypothetical protein